MNECALAKSALVILGLTRLKICAPKRCAGKVNYEVYTYVYYGELVIVCEIEGASGGL